MLKANKNELLSFALAGFLIVNSGFTAPHEMIENEDASAAQVEQVPIENNAPTSVSVSEDGTIALASEEQKAQFGLVEALNEIERQSELEAQAIEPNVEEPVVEEELAVEPIEEIEESEESEPIDQVEYVEEQPGYGAVMAMEATAYLPTDGGGGGITAMGIPATYGVAAVDPGVIPLGSRLYIPGYGEAIAADTGGAIYGYRIDLCMESYAQAMEFGRRVVTVYVLDY